MSNIHILTNPLSGKNRKHPTRFDKMMSVANQHCAPENTLTTHQPHGLDALLESVQSMKESGADILCIDGGDGTIHQTFTALWKVYGMNPLSHHCATERRNDEQHRSQYRRWILDHGRISPQDNRSKW